MTNSYVGNITVINSIQRLTIIISMNIHLMSVNLLYRCAISAFLSFATKNGGIEIGLFYVVHTFGRQLNWNFHFHTRGGINLKTKRWGDIYFNVAMVEQHWKQQAVSFLRDHYHNLNTKLSTY